jgi:hypothetical protein
MVRAGKEPNRRSMCGKEIYSDFKERMESFQLSAISLQPEYEAGSEVVHFLKK